MTRLFPLLLLAACSRPSKPDPNVRELIGNLAAVCSAYEHSAQVAQVDTVTAEPNQPWHSQAEAVCSSVAEPQ